MKEISIEAITANSSEHVKKLIKWIFDNFITWEKICGVRKMTKEESEKVIKILEKHEFAELIAVVITRQSAIEDYKNINRK